MARKRETRICQDCAAYQNENGELKRAVEHLTSLLKRFNEANESLKVRATHWEHALKTQIVAYSKEKQNHDEERSRLKEIEEGIENWFVYEVRRAKDGVMKKDFPQSLSVLVWRGPKDHSIFRKLFYKKTRHLQSTFEGKPHFNILVHR